MAVKILTPEQMKQLAEYTLPFHKDKECPAETAIRKMNEQRDRITELESTVKSLQNELGDADEEICLLGELLDERDED